MRNLPVHWSEGMFLLPQHFQASDQHWTELMSTSEQLDHEYNYGLRRLEISEAAIGNFQFQVNSCVVRLRDGTVLSLTSNDELDRLEVRDALAAADAGGPKLTADLQESFNAGSTVRVFLAVPKLRMGQANVAIDGDVAQHRYLEVKQVKQDESAGENDQEIGLKQYSVRLMLSTQDMSGYEVLPIAQIERSGDRAGTPQLDIKYIPPLLGVDSWSPLARGIIREIYDIIGKKIEVLSEQVQSRGLSLSSQEPGDMERVFMLSQISEAYTSLGVLTFLQGLHPLPAYHELCRIVGKLSIFGKDRRPPEVPRYDHDDLATIFYWVKARILALLDEIQPPEWVQRPFKGVEGLGLQVTFDSKWLSNDWKWFVGAMYESISEEECRELLTPGYLDWKLGSKPEVERLFQNALPGLKLEPLTYTPRPLPTSRNWVYYAVSREGSAWKDVQLTQTLAMRLKDSLIMNKAELEGKQKLLVKFRGRQAGLEFALFAVRAQA